jgi:hypothetical protein
VRVFPIRDLNPTHGTPVVTLLVIAACVGVFFLFQQPQTPREGMDFGLRHAAIACELTWRGMTFMNPQRSR